MIHEVLEISLSYSWYTVIDYTGGSDWDTANGRTYDDILEYDPEEDSITTVGQMTQARVEHAVTVVEASKYTLWCDGSM